MPKINTLFWDLGGVLLTNAWDHNERLQTLKRFSIAEKDFNERHENVVSAFERGTLSLDEYLDKTVFYQEVPFTKRAFVDDMFTLSQPLPDSLALARELSGKYFMSTINNESTELNLYRIQQFGLRDIFSLFVSSCFVGLQKPELPIYKLALEITQKPPELCCFIDDRAANLLPAKQLGMQVIQMKSAGQLREELKDLGVKA